jgi:riboflavin kinase/FMN adenylyltransferase
MEIILGLEQLKRPLRNPVVTLGNFDGVHLGHQRILRRVKEEASKIAGEAVVITFEPHPLKILAPERCPPLLSSFRKKMMLIEKSGIETVLCIQFSLLFSRITPFVFVRSILVDKIGARKIIVGYNYRFGKGQRGDVSILKKICDPFHVEVEVADALRIGDTTVSSSKIRELIKTGSVEEASRLLGRDYPIIGRVAEGAKRGQTLGFPTANVEAVDELYPLEGIYAVEVSRHGERFKGVANIGYNPTFVPEAGEKRKTPTLEVHILDFNRNIYGEEIEVNFKKRIRDEIRFSSPAELVTQIRKDIEWAKENVFGKTVPHHGATE